MGTEATQTLLQERHAKFQSLSPEARRAAARLDARERESAALREEYPAMVREAAEKVKRVRADSVALLTILQAARNLPETFHVEDLLVAVWKLDPKRFGMRQYDYPDMHRLRPHIDGKRGLVAREILQSVGRNLLRLGPLAAKRTEDPMPRG